MFDLLVGLTVWYGLGFAAALWAGHRGHDRGLWTIAAALWGALTVPALALVRLALRVRPQKFAVPERALDGGTVAVVMHAKDSAAALGKQVRSLTEPIRTLAVIVLVTEEAGADLIATSEMKAAETTVRCMLRNAPPVRATSTITTLSGVEQLVRQGWRADVLVTSPLVAERPLGAPMARVVKRLGSPAVDTQHSRPSQPSRPLHRPAADRPAPAEAADPRTTVGAV